MDNNQQQNSDQQVNDIPNQLVHLRDQAVSALSDTIRQQDDIDPVEKFEAALNLLKYGVNIEIIQVALNAALQIQPAGQRSELLTRLINEVDFLIDSVK